MSSAVPMSGSRLEGRVALFAGGGQAPGATIGNGRARRSPFRSSRSFLFRSECMDSRMGRQRSLPPAGAMFLISGIS